MVYVAQLAECLIVIQEVMGSTPIIHTNILVVQWKRTCGYEPQDGSSNLSEDTKDDKKRRMTDVERRVARVHTKDK